MALRLIVVDDNRDAADSVAVLLERAGYDVRVAYGGKQAIELARSFHPDVLIVDIVMPILDGFQVAKQLRAMPQFEHAHFVALSGHGEQTHLDEASNVQFDEYLLKPPKMNVVLTILSEVSAHLGK